MGHRRGHSAPPRNIRNEIAQRTTGLWCELIRAQNGCCCNEQRLLGSAGMAMDGRQRLVTEPTLRLIHNPLEGQVVSGCMNKAQIRQRISVVGAFPKAPSADYLVRNTNCDKPLFKISCLKLSADQNGDFVEAPTGSHVTLDLLTDPPRFLRSVPHTDDPYLLAVARVGPQRLAEAAGIVGDEAVGGGEDMACRAVILLEADDLRAGEVLLEAEDVGDLSTAPAVDRLIVVADAAEVAARLGKQLQPFVLRLVRVLILVDEDVAEAV